MLQKKQERNSNIGRRKMRLPIDLLCSFVLVCRPVRVVFHTADGLICPYADKVGGFCVQTADGFGADLVVGKGYSFSRFEIHISAILNLIASALL